MLKVKNKPNFIVTSTDYDKQLNQLMVVCHSLNLIAIANCSTIDLYRKDETFNLKYINSIDINSDDNNNEKNKLSIITCLQFYENDNLLAIGISNPGYDCKLQVLKLSYRATIIDEINPILVRVLIDVDINNTNFKTHKTNLTNIPSFINNIIFITNQSIILLFNLEYRMNDILLIDWSIDGHIMPNYYRIPGHANTISALDTIILNEEENEIFIISISINNEIILWKYLLKNMTNPIIQYKKSLSSSKNINMKIPLYIYFIPGCIDTTICSLSQDNILSFYNMNDLSIIKQYPSIISILENTCFLSKPIIYLNKIYILNGGKLKKPMIENEKYVYNMIPIAFNNKIKLPSLYDLANMNHIMMNFHHIKGFHNYIDNATLIIPILSNIGITFSTFYSDNTIPDQDQNQNQKKNMIENKENMNQQYKTTTTTTTTTTMLVEEKKKYVIIEDDKLCNISKLQLPKINIQSKEPQKLTNENFKQQVIQLSKRVHIVESELANLHQSFILYTQDINTQMNTILDILKNKNKK